MRNIAATIELDASPERVWSVLSDVDDYVNWNPFITSLAGRLSVGEKLVVRIKPPDGRPMTFHPTVTEVEPGLRLAWLGHLGVPGIFDGTHTFTLAPLPDGRTQLVQSESFSGVLSFIAGRLLARTQAGFDGMHQ